MVGRIPNIKLGRLERRESKSLSHTVGSFVSSEYLFHNNVFISSDSSNVSSSYKSL